jgi:hypothetical protein
MCVCMCVYVCVCVCVCAQFVIVCVSLNIWYMGVFVWDRADVEYVIPQTLTLVHVLRRGFGVMLWCVSGNYFEYGWCEAGSFNPRSCYANIEIVQ